MAVDASFYVHTERGHIHVCRNLPEPGDRDRDVQLWDIALSLVEETQTAYGMKDVEEMRDFLDGVARRHTKERRKTFKA